MWPVALKLYMFNGKLNGYTNIMFYRGAVSLLVKMLTLSHKRSSLAKKKKQKKKQ